MIYELDWWNILLSVRAPYAKALLDGSKQVEFRKQNMPSRIKRVFVYETAPVGRIVGQFDVARVVRCTPAEAWAEFGGVGFIGKKEFNKYYKGCKEAVVLVVKSSQEYVFDVNVKINGSPRPPQSFCYVHDDKARLIRDVGMRVVYCVEGKL